MSDLRGFAKQTNVSREGTGGGWLPARAMLDGSMVTASWIQALIMEGYGFSANYGSAANSATTVGTFGAGGIDLDEFDLLQTLPANGSVGIIPLYYQPVLEVIGTIAAVDLALVYGSGGIAGANTISVTPANMRPDSSIASASTVVGLGDDGGTVITVGSFIWRDGTTALTGATTEYPLHNLYWSIQKHGFAPVIVGASRQVAGFASAQASTGFITYQWLEMPDEFFA